MGILTAEQTQALKQVFRALEAKESGLSVGRKIALRGLLADAFIQIDFKGG